MAIITHGKISITEFERRYSTGYEFLVSSRTQYPDNSIPFSFLQVYDQIYISLDPDAIVLMDSKGHGRLGIGVIRSISRRSDTERDGVSILEIVYTIRYKEYRIFVEAHKVK